MGCFCLGEGTRYDSSVKRTPCLSSLLEEPPFLSQSLPLSTFLWAFVSSRRDCGPRREAMRHEEEHLQEAMKVRSSPHDRSCT